MIGFNRERAVHAVAGITSFVWVPIYAVYRGFASWGKDWLDICGIEITVNLNRTSDEVSRCL